MIRGSIRGRFGGAAPGSIDMSYGYDYQSYPEKDDLVAGSFGNADLSQGYVHERLAPSSSEPYDCFETSSSDRFGPYESHDSGSSRVGRDLLRSGFGSSFDGGHDSSVPSKRFDEEESSWDSSCLGDPVGSGFLDNGGRGVFSSYTGDFSPPLMRPAPSGSRGRGIPAYPQNSRSSDVEGPPAFRGRGRGFIPSTTDGRRLPDSSQLSMGPLERAPLAVWQFRKPSPGFGFTQQYPAEAASSLKRKMMAPIQPAGFAKRLKHVSVLKDIAGMRNSAEGAPKADGVCKAESEASVERQRRSRREKQRRRREKEMAKYGDIHRLAFTCAFCKVRTCDEKEVEEHFESPFHWNTLEHIQKQTKFDKMAVNFLHESMVNKFRKTVLRKRNSGSADPATEDTQQDLAKVLKEEMCLTRVEMILCTACHAYIPASLSSIQQHLNSVEHRRSKQEFSETQKRESVLMATRIMTSPDVKNRYEKYLKGENPFEEEVREEPTERAQENPTDGPMDSGVVPHDELQAL